MRFVDNLGIVAESMNVTMFEVWVAIGAVLMLAEFLLPGLVAVFVGLGALTVALFMYLGWVDSVFAQVVTWVATSTVYTFTLRVLVIRLYPGDTVAQNVDEDSELVGQVVQVTTAIGPESIGRIAHSDSTWQARTSDGQTIDVGQKAKIIGRENITLIVEKASEAEN